jgi:protein disulfide-isomerase
MKLPSVGTSALRPVALSVFSAALLTAFAFSALATRTLAVDVAKEGAEPGKWTMDFDAAVKLAKEKNLPILINFTGSDWCGWCKLMDELVFAKKEWQEFAASNLVLVTIDFPNDKSIVPDKWTTRNEQLSEKWGIRGYPTYVLLDSEGATEIARLGASRNATPESFIQEMKDALQPASASSAEKRY